MKKVFLIIIFIILIGIIIFPNLATAQSTVNIKGMSFYDQGSDAYSNTAVYDEMKKMANLGIEWVSFTVYFHMQTYNSTTLSYAGYNPTKENLRQAIRNAHNFSLKVMFKPHVDSGDDRWAGRIYPTDWDTWFVSYRSLLNEYAILCEEEGVELLSIGNELSSSTGSDDIASYPHPTTNMDDPYNEANWRETIRQVRQVYSRKLTIALTHWQTIDNSFYAADALDYIGINPYFPFSTSIDDNVTQMVSNWETITFSLGRSATYSNPKQIIINLQNYWNKPILFTEVGIQYGSTSGYPDQQEIQWQANAYEAFLRLWGNWTPLQGIFWWEWNLNTKWMWTYHYSPQDKPAEQVIKDWFLIPERFLVKGQLKDKNNNPVQASIISYNQGTSIVNSNNQTDVNGNYILSVEPNFYDIQFNITNFFIPSFWIKLLSLNLTSDTQNLVNYVTEYPSENKLSFTVNITNNQTIQTHNPEKPKRVLINGSVITEVTSFNELKNNTWFYNNSEQKLYMIVSSNLPFSKKVAFRTSHWLCKDPVYGINGTDINAMPVLVDKINASDILVYFKDSSMPSWDWEKLIDCVDFWKNRSKNVWIYMGKTTLDEPDETTYSVQYVIDTFKGKIKGIFFDYWYALPPANSTDWLLSKKEQLANNSMEIGYYHGDGFAADYGNPATDVNATYLSNQGLIPIAWLMQDCSWKPVTSNLSRFWIDYDILNGTSGQFTGQSYDQIYSQWYMGCVIGNKNLKNNPGCEALVFMIYNDKDWPNPDAINGMVAATNDWLK